MTGAAETFAVTLARASRQANRFLRSRQLHRDARDDVIAAAMLWCWENRDNYSIIATLEVWFLGAVRNAYRAYLRGEIRNGTTEIVENMGTKDDPAYNVMLQDAVAALAANMDEMDRAIVRLTLDGKNQREVREALELSRDTVDRRLSKMRDKIPASAHANTILRRVATPPMSSNYDGDETQTEQAHREKRPSRIEKEIEALDFPPATGKECPPCWRCKYFDGFLPGDRRSVRMDLAERKVKAAVLMTERRKIRIAQEVRDGHL